LEQGSFILMIVISTSALGRAAADTTVIAERAKVRVVEKCIFKADLEAWS
jgi:hypothetical protein